MTCQLDWDLIKKYDKPGPRYTSYPTAPAFNESVGADTLVDYLSHQRESQTPLSLYVHIPFCHKLCWYCGCNMQVSRNREKMNSHVQLIRDEMLRMRDNIRTDRETCQIHLGGGTPNYLDTDELMALMYFMRRNFPISKDAEISLELDPRHITAEQVRGYKICGFNRVSLGIQDFHPDVQSAINRIQPFPMVRQAFSWLREEGFDSINTDLIYGLPRQTPERFANTVNQLIELAPDRVALFNYAYVPQLKPHMKLIHGDELPDPRTKFAILQRTIDQLMDAGYVYIGMDHFAKPGDPLAQAMERGELHRNFQGYTTHPETEMLAFGMSAISMMDRLYVQNISRLGEYEDAIRAGGLATWRGYQLDDDDVLRRGIINRFMCQQRIDIDEIQEMTGEPFDTYFPDARHSLDEMASDGLLRQTDQGWQATFLGQLLMRNVAMVFDRYLAEMIAKRKASFSRTV